MSEDTPTPPPNPGLALKEARERLGLSINDVSTSTKINPGVLRALEEGRLDDLPPRTFTRGFIRSYAQYLKIDPDPIVEAFDLNDPFISSLGKESGEDTTPTTVQSKSSNLNAASLGPRVILMGAIIALILMIVGIKKVVDKYSKETIPPVTAQTESGTPILTADDEVEETEVSDDEAEAQAIADAILADDPALQKMAEKKNSAESAVEPAAELTAAATPTATPTPTAIATPTPTPTPTPTATPTPQPTAEPDKKATPTISYNHEVIIEATGDVEIEVTLDKGDDDDIDMKAGQVRIFKASKLIEIEADDAGAVNVIYNGKDLGAAGKSGKSIDLKFPK